jgi:hypothetical protein
VKLEARDNPEERARLRALATEIGDLLARHDVAGCIVLQAPGSAEYLFRLTPSWSCLSLEAGPDGASVVRFKANVKTGGPEERQRANRSIGMLMSMAELLSSQAAQVAKLVGHFGGQLGHVEHISRRMG